MDGGFVRELCVALEHRWKPAELFVLFTAHFDEADTHGAAPHMAMGALLGHARQWEIFGRRLRAIQRTEDFKIFHATEFKAGKGEFFGWSQEKSQRIVNDLADLIKDTLTEGALINLPYNRYVSEYRNSFTPKGVGLDSQYGVCFRALMAQIFGIIQGIGGKHKLHVVIERGHNNAKNTEKIFYEMRETLKARGVDLFGTWTLAPKDECAPLMLADYLVHTYAMMIRPGGMGIAGYANQASEAPKREAGLTFLEFQPGALAESKLVMQQQRLERRAYARRIKAEAKAALTVSSGRVLE